MSGVSHGSDRYSTGNFANTDTPRRIGAFTVRRYQGAVKLRGEGLGGGKVFEKPSNVIALAVTTAWDVMICYCPLAVKVMHVFETTT
jgi:hypothetical protein